jgi:hypothetical protein
MAAFSVVPAPHMAPASTPTGLPALDRMRTLAGEAEALAPVDPAGARASLAGLRELVAEMAPGAVTRPVEGLLRIVETLDADLAAGGVRSITGLVRQVNRLERVAPRT